MTAPQTILVSLLLAAGAVAQEATPLDRRVDLETEGATLAEVVLELVEQTGLSFVADDMALDVAGITLQLFRVSAREALRAIDHVLRDVSIETMGSALIAIAYEGPRPTPIAIRTVSETPALRLFPPIQPPPPPPTVGEAQPPELTPEPDPGVEPELDPLPEDLELPTLAELYLAVAIARWEAGELEEARVYLGMALGEDDSLRDDPEHREVIRAIREER